MTGAVAAVLGSFSARVQRRRRGDARRPRAARYGTLDLAGAWLAMRWAGRRFRVACRQSWSPPRRVILSVARPGPATIASESESVTAESPWRDAACSGRSVAVAGRRSGRGPGLGRGPRSRAHDPRRCGRRCASRQLTSSERRELRRLLQGELSPVAPRGVKKSIDKVNHEESCAATRPSAPWLLSVVCWPRARPGGARQPAVAAMPRPVTPAEIQRMFDAYALVQAQDQLKLGDDQYPRFLARFKALQEIRRRAQAERTRRPGAPASGARRQVGRVAAEGSIRRCRTSTPAPPADQEGLRRHRSGARRAAAGAVPRVRRADGAAQDRAGHPGPPEQSRRTTVQTPGARGQP